MKIKLLHYTPLHVASIAIRHCWETENKSDSYKICRNCDTDISNVKSEDDGQTFCLDCGIELSLNTVTTQLGIKDRQLIDRVANKFKHESTIEHISYSFDIDGISRGVLQELVRHRLSSYSVKSTRYTLKRIKGLKFVKNTLALKFYASDKFISENNLKGYCDSTYKIPVTDLIVLTNNNIIDNISIMNLDNLCKALEQNISNDIAKYPLPECFKTRLTWTINARSLRNFLTLRTSKSALWEIRKLAYQIYDVIPLEHKFLFKEYINDKQD